MTTPTDPSDTRRRLAVIVAAVIVVLAVAAIAVAQRGAEDAATADADGASEIVAAPSPPDATELPATDEGAAPNDDASAGDEPTSDAAQPDVTAAPDAEPAAPGDEPTSDGDEPGDGEPETALWGRQFGSVSVTEDGQPRTLVPGTQLTISFTSNQNGEAVGWSGSCNAHSATLDVTPTQLTDLRDDFSTAVGCDQPRQEQDDFFTDFLFSTPTWELAGEGLTLRSGDTVIVFEESE